MELKLLWCLVFIAMSIYARKLTRRAVWERFVENYSDPNYTRIQLNMTKPDRKMFSVNISVEILQDLPLEAKIKAVLYKHTDNVFKKTAFAYEGTVCEYYDVIQKSIIDMDENLFKNFINRCPVTKFNALFINQKFDFGLAITEKLFQNIGRVLITSLGYKIMGVYSIHNLNEKIVTNPMLPLWRCKLEFAFSIPDKELFNGTLYFTVIEV